MTTASSWRAARIPVTATRGHLIYARGGALLAVPFELDELQVKGPPAQVLDGVAWSGQGNAPFSLGSSGTLVYAPGGSPAEKHSVLQVDRAGQAESLIELERAFLDARLSPDERRLALESGGVNHSLWVYDLERATLTRLAVGFDNQRPVWTADDQRLLLASSRSGPKNLFWQLADGSLPAERLTSSGYPQERGSWSPDGATLVFDENRPETGWDLWTLSADDRGNPRPYLATPFMERLPVFSPDGRFIACESDESGEIEVYVRSYPGSAATWRVSTGGGRLPAWNTDGRELFYRNADQLLAVDFDAGEKLVLGNPRMLFKKRSVQGRYDVTRDGQHFVMVADSATFRAPTHLNLVLNWSSELERLARP